MCKNPIKNFITCKVCQMVSYCSDDHSKVDFMSHKPLCDVIKELSVKRGEFATIKKLPLFTNIPTILVCKYSYMSMISKF